MNKADIEKQVIEKYQQDEKMMILLFAQWCVNQELDPVEVYKKAYPNQIENNALIEAIDQTVPKNESEEIPKDLLLQVLQLFGNDDLAFIVQEEAEKQQKQG